MNRRKFLSGVVAVVAGGKIAESSFASDKKVTMTIKLDASELKKVIPDRIWHAKGPDFGSDYDFMYHAISLKNSLTSNCGCAES